MEIEDLKIIWKQDMDQLVERVQLNEQRIRKIEFGKAQSSFDKFLKISLAGKNLALVYAAISLFLISRVINAPLYMAFIAVGGVAMVFSYFQHSVLKKVDYGSLSILELQKTIYNFRIHTSRTAVYDFSIVGIWMITSGVGYIKWSYGWDMMNNSETIIPIITGIAIWILISFIGAKIIYKNIDKKLKENEDNLESILHYEMNTI